MTLTRYQYTYIPYEHTLQRKLAQTCYTKTKCIVCGNLIINNQQSGRNHCRIAHLSCTKRYWDKRDKLT